MGTASVADAGAGDPTGMRATEGVRTLMGDPKRAIIKLSVPMIVAMSIQTVYNVADAIWVSGLGPDALAAVGFFFPFFFILIAVATGIGVGASSALSRRIGARDKDGADNVAIHSLIMMMVAAAVMTLVFVPLTRPMFATIGAGNVLDLVVPYAHIVFGATAVLFFFNWATAVMRGEGDVKRPMYATAFGVVLNIVLDPIFIYTLGLGVAGAGWATLVGMSIGAVPLLYWMFVKRDTYVTMRRCCFAYSTPIVKDILKVGLPATVMQVSMSLSVIALNLIVVDIGGSDGVAVFTTGWRVATIGILPLLGIATAVVSVTGAAYGAREYGKLTTAYTYAIRVGFVIELVVAAVTFLLASQIAAVFTTGEGGERIRAELELMVMIIVVHYPFIALGMFSSSMFQGTGKGLYALAVTLLRAVGLTIAFAALFAHLLDWGLVGVWWGMNLGNIGGSAVAYVWARYYIAHLGGLDRVEEPEAVTV